MPEGDLTAPPGEVNHVRSADGTAIAFMRWPGGEDAPAALFVHASGFCKEVWRPAVEELAASGSPIRSIAIDQRVHGDSDKPAPPIRWRDFGDDLAAVMATIGGPVVGVGHSSGGAAVVIAELARPGTFVAMVLVEPIINPAPFRRSEVNPMSRAALKRQASFATRDEARANFTGKGPFAGWDPRALDAYVEGGLRHADDGRWVLKCDPQSEAEFYRGATEHESWDHLSEITCPVRLFAGAESDSHQGVYLERLAAQFDGADVEIVDGATHFVPMERPDLVAEWVIAAAAAGKATG